MTNSEKSQLYLKRIKRCFLIMKISVFGAMAAVAALVVFVSIASATGLKTTAPESFLIGVSVCAALAVALLIVPFTCIIISKITLVKLNKLDDREARN